ncbi:FCD domain-containing protein [Amycolatopsis carbonis]|uniref:FCD domain-containing protein n=1 Tax=Amycolatopsis carbonis TaxID=715471 RepID=UPI0033429747
MCERRDRSSVVTELTEHLERLRRPESLAADLDADLEFHGTMCRLAGNQLLLQSREGISSLARITMLAAGPTWPTSATRPSSTSSPAAIRPRAASSWPTTWLPHEIGSSGASRPQP